MLGEKIQHLRDWKQSNTAAWLAQLGERRPAGREVAGLNPDLTNTQGL